MSPSALLHEEGAMTRPGHAENGGGDLHSHIAGDVHSARGFHYECALRCLWLLDLRGTQDQLSVADGEDARILRADGRVIYRQAKKREGSHWTLDTGLQKFIKRAYARIRRRIPPPATNSTQIRQPPQSRPAGAAVVPLEREPPRRLSAGSEQHGLILPDSPPLHGSWGAGGPPECASTSSSDCSK